MTEGFSVHDNYSDAMVLIGPVFERSEQAWNDVRGLIPDMADVNREVMVHLARSAPGIESTKARGGRSVLVRVGRGDEQVECQRHRAYTRLFIGSDITQTRDVDCARAVFMGAARCFAGWLASQIRSAPGVRVVRWWGESLLLHPKKRDQVPWVAVDPDRDGFSVLLASYFALTPYGEEIVDE